MKEEGISYQTYSIDKDGILQSGAESTITSGKVYIPYS
nr:MAG TPA: hypothetical protein [Caudoviricetes sp.]